MAVPAKKQDALAKKPPTQGLIDVIRSKENSLRDVCGKYLSATRLVKLAVVMVTKVPDLAKVPPLQVVQELMNCARLGLEPHCEGGRWFIVFDGKKGAELVGVTDYRGLIDIARRSGHVRAIHADIVREGDVWEYRVDTTGDVLLHLRHEPRRLPNGKLGPILGAYAVVRLKNGQAQGKYLEIDEINDVMARSPSAKASISPWKSDWKAMALKTAVRRVYNLLPKSPEIRKAQEIEASDEENERARLAIDITPPDGRTENVRQRLGRKLAEEGAPPAEEPPPGTATDVAGLDAEAEQQEQEHQREVGEEG